MQQSCFSYNKKGPFYIQEDKTPKEKAACKADLKARNTARYEEDKLNQEVANGISRVRLRNKPRTKSQFQHNEDTGAYVLKDRRGGINWYRY